MWRSSLSVVGGFYIFWMAAVVFGMLYIDTIIQYQGWWHDVPLPGIGWDALLLLFGGGYFSVALLRIAFSALMGGLAVGIIGGRNSWFGAILIGALIVTARNACLHFWLDAPSWHLYLRDIELTGGTIVEMGVMFSALLGSAPLGDRLTRWMERTIVGNDSRAPFRSRNAVFGWVMGSAIVLVMLGRLLHAGLMEGTVRRFLGEPGGEHTAYYGGIKHESDLGYSLGFHNRSYDLNLNFDQKERLTQASLMPQP